MTFDVRLGGLTMVGDERSADFTINAGGLQGWFSGGASMRRDVEDRPTSHGQFGAPGYLSGRIVRIVGKLHASSPFDYERKAGRLAAVLADGEAAQMVVQGAETTRALVYRSATPDINPIVYGELAEFELELWSPDPRRYGESRDFTGAAAYHRGTFPALPILTVTGNMPGGYSITGPGGRVYSVTAGLPAGSTDQIDMRTGWLKRNGADLGGATGRADTWAIPPGVQVTHTLSPVSGSGQLTATLTDTYV